MKILRVGDPHARVSCLDEMKRFILFIAEQTKLHEVNRIEILGDLLHTHNIIRLEVLEFWTWALYLLSDICEVVVLIGNHDQSGDYNSTFNALTLFGLLKKPNLVIVEKPTQLGEFGYIPYTHDHAQFIQSANLLADGGVSILVCHQTIEGSKYDNGLWAPEGISPVGWADRFERIISGHIHTEQSFGNIVYPGTGRWDTISDANRRKGIWLYEYNLGGVNGKETFISTERVCSPIKHFEYREGTECPIWEPNDRVSVEIIGSAVWVTAEKEKLKGKCSIKTKITSSTKKVTRQTGNSFEQFVKELFPSTMNKENLLKYAKEIGIV